MYVPLLFPEIDSVLGPLILHIARFIAFHLVDAALADGLVALVLFAMTRLTHAHGEHIRRFHLLLLQNCCVRVYMYKCKLECASLAISGDNRLVEGGFGTTPQRFGPNIVFFRLINFLVI